MSFFDALPVFLYALVLQYYIDDLISSSKATIRAMLPRLSIAPLIRRPLRCAYRHGSPHINAALLLAEESGRGRRLPGGHMPRFFGDGRHSRVFTRRPRFRRAEDFTSLSMFLAAKFDSLPAEAAFCAWYAACSTSPCSHFYFLVKDFARYSFLQPARYRRYCFQVSTMKRMLFHVPSLPCSRQGARRASIISITHSRIGRSYRCHAGWFDASGQVPQSSISSSSEGSGQRGDGCRPCHARRMPNMSSERGASAPAAAIAFLAA